jgi:hypothetical protein
MAQLTGALWPHGIAMTAPAARMASPLADPLPLVFCHRRRGAAGDLDDHDRPDRSRCADGCRSVDIGARVSSRSLAMNR